MNNKSKCSELAAVILLIATLLFECGGAFAQQGNGPARVVAQLGHGSAISAVAISPDGRLVASGDNQGVVLIWDVTTGRMLLALRADSDPVRSVRFSADGKKAFVAHWQSLRIWDLRLGIVEHQTDAPQNGAFERGLFFPSGKKVIYANDQSPTVLDLQSGVQLDFPARHSDSVDALALSSDGTRAFSSSATSLRLWNALDRTLIRKIELKSSGVNGLALSAKGDVGISATGNDLSVWDLGVGGLSKRLLGHKEKVWAVSMSADGKLGLSGGADKTVKLWNVQSGVLINSFDGNSDQVQAVAISDDSRLVVAGGDDRAVRIWKVESGTLLHAFVGSKLENPALAVSKDGSVLFHLATPNRAAVLHTFTGRGLSSLSLTAPAEAAALSLDGKMALIGGSKGEISFWKIAGGQKPLSIPAQRSAIKVMGFGNSDSVFLVGSADKELSLWDTNSRTLIRRMKGLPAEPKAISLAEGGSAIVALDRNCTIKKWTYSTGAFRSRPGKASPEGTCLNAAFSPDGKLALAGSDNNAVAWVYDVDKNERTNSGQEIRVLEGHRIDISSVSFSPSGELALSATPDGEVKLWSVKSWTSVGTFPTIPGGVSASAFLSDNRFVVANSSGELFFLTRQGNQVQARHKEYPDGSWITVTPEGFFDSSGDGAKNLSVVLGLEVYSIDQAYQALYRPDLVQEKLAGDPKGLVREAAAKLDLDKVMASGNAPRVSIVAPSGNAADDEVTVEARIDEQNGGGIGKIEWRVNGVTLGIDARGMQRLPEGTAASPVTSRPAVTVRRSLALEPGENRIEVVAYNGRDLIASDPARLILKWDGEKSATPPKLHVLAVGVNDYYDSRLKLSYAVPDAKALGDAMKKAGSSMYQSVEVTSVLDDGVTVENLDKVFAEVSRKVHPRDVFVFFLAGHGKTVDGRYHFLPQNFRYEDESSIAKRGIDQDRFQGWFAKIPARKSILLYDTCESGSLTGERVAQRGIERVAALERMTRAMGRTVLSASSDDAPALEGYRGHGVFTYALLDGLAGADTNGNGLIEVTELAAFIDQKVPDLSYQAFKMRQIPQMKIVGNSFPVVSKTSVLEAIGSQSEAPTSVPTKPTHVVVLSFAEVHAVAGASTAVVQKLPSGTLVRLVETTSGWLLIAKDGQKLGYVEEKALLKLQ